MGHRIVDFESMQLQAFRKCIGRRKRLGWNAQVVKSQPLEKILHDKVGAEEFYFDFFTLDVEGAELSLLRSINLILLDSE